MLPWPTLVRYTTGIVCVFYGALAIIFSQPA